MPETAKPKLTVNTGPFKNVVVLGHTSVEERDREAGKIGSTLEDADYSDLYRSTLPEIHDKAAPMLLQLSGVTRGVNEAQTKKNQARMKEGKVAKDVPETFVDYATRVKASVDESVWAQIEEKFREIALATPVDASPSKRVGQASKANVEKAKEVLSRDIDEIEEKVEMLLAEVPSFDLLRDEDGKPEENSFARLIGAFIASREAKAKAAI